MPEPTGPSARPAGPPGRRLTITLGTARLAIAGRVSSGRELLAEPLSTAAELQARRSGYNAWRDYNVQWLHDRLGPPLAEEYAPRKGYPTWGVVPTVAQEIAELRGMIEHEIRQLESIATRLHFWLDEGKSRLDDPSAPPATVDPAVIFVVHGDNAACAREVARMIGRSTGRDAVILREQPQDGRTAIERFDEVVTGAAFAVVVLTGDDEGRSRRELSDPCRRGRQDVIFELGFFFGKLGRDRVVVLVEEGVEHPSAVNGLFYTELDRAGAWQQDLARAMGAAGIQVRINRLP